MKINFDNTYSRLPAVFYAPSTPDSPKRPFLLEFNFKLAQELGIDASDLSKEDLCAFFSGKRLPAGASPIALAYAGHQFGHFVPQLGDGRAVLLGEVLGKDGRRFDLQLKGSGPTTFSRNGDGKSALGPVVREYLLSEAMHHLGIPSTRALCAVATGEEVYRQEGALPGGVFTRVAASHIRVGTFEYFAARQDLPSLQKLLEYSIRRHYAHIPLEGDYVYAFVKAVAKRQASLVGKWLGVGFIHGVMNTDNMSISGETLDFGPCAFMDSFSQAKVFSSIDHQGRYAYQNQIPVAQWNLYRLAETLLPLCDPAKNPLELMQENLEECMGYYKSAWLESMCPKFGLSTIREEDKDWIGEWLALLEGNTLDYSESFRKLGESPSSFTDLPGFADFLEKWRQRLESEGITPEVAAQRMRGVNPAFIPRNHQVERAIAAVIQGDLSLFKSLNALLEKPFEHQERFAEFAKPPEPHQIVHETFCGT